MFRSSPLMHSSINYRRSTSCCSVRSLSFSHRKINQEVMLSPPILSSTNGSSRRPHYSRSSPSAKRLKTTNFIEPYERFYPNEFESFRPYTSICVKNLHPKLSDTDIRELCTKKFSKYGHLSVRIYYKNQERMAFVNFTNWEDAKRARYATSGLVWENIRVIIEPVYYRRSIPPEHPYNRHHRPPSPPVLPSPPPPSIRKHYSSRPSRRPYAPYIPLPPDLLDYMHPPMASATATMMPTNSRSRQRSSPSPVRRHEQRKSRRSRSSSNSTHVDDEFRMQNEPSRILIVESIDGDLSESKLRDIFGRYGTIEQIRLKKSKRVGALIQYENVDMAHQARQAIDGHVIGKTEYKISYGQTTPSKYLWVGNIPIHVKRRDLEHAFSRYGQIKSLEFANGDPTAIITYNDSEDAIKARSKLIGVIQLNNGRGVRDELNLSPSPNRGLRIDFLERPTTRRFVIVRARPSSSSSSSSARSDDHPPLLSPSPVPIAPAAAEQSEEEAEDEHEHKKENDDEEEQDEATADAETLKTEPESPKSSPIIKQRRSTDRSETPIQIPTAGRTFYPPLGSYLSTKDTENIQNIPQLMDLCEQLNHSATQNSTALSTVYPVQFILKSHGYDARMHFLAGSPTLASVVLGQPGDLVAAKTELRITQRLRLDQHKLDDLERNLRTNVNNSLAIGDMSIHGSDLTLDLYQNSAANRTKFVILIASPSKEQREDISPKNVKNEASTPPLSSIIVKQELIDPLTEDNGNDDDESSLSRLIAYLISKEAAGVISIPFYPTSFDEHNHSSKQDIAVLHIFPPCDFTEKILKILCPNFHHLSSNSSVDNEHLMLIIVHND